MILLSMIYLEEEPEQPGVEVAVPEAGAGWGPRSCCPVSVLGSGRKLRCIGREEARGAALRCRCYTEEWSCCTGLSSTSAAVRTCLVNCGAAAAGRISRRTVSPRGVSCRTGHSQSSGGIGRSGSPPPVWAGPCKCHSCPRYCYCVGEAAGRHWRSAGHHSHGCLEARVLAFESAAAHRNSKPER